ncbi:MAG: hypothetical protein JRN59_00625 [Nitrososphaerota archaeon]|nr:hypothetical protein [Nitrososphaerota archaeon]
MAASRPPIEELQAEARRRARRIVTTSAMAAPASGGAEAPGYLIGDLRAREACLLTPTVPMLVTFAST